MLRFGVYTDEVIKELNTVRIIVIVPNIALISESEIIDTTYDTVYYEGIPASNLHPELKKTLVNNILDDDEEVHFTKKIYGTAVPGFYDENSGLKRNSENIQTEAYLSLAEIIDIYHEGFYIYVKNSDDVFMLTKLLSSYLDKLDIAIDVSNAKKIKEYINEFYETLIANKKETIEDKIYGKSNNEIFMDHTKLIRKKNIANVAIRG